MESRKGKQKGEAMPLFTSIRGGVVIKGFDIKLNNEETFEYRFSVDELENELIKHSSYLNDFNKEDLGLHKGKIKDGSFKLYLNDYIGLGVVLENISDELDEIYEHYVVSCLTIYYKGISSEDNKSRTDDHKIEFSEIGEYLRKIDCVQVVFTQNNEEKRMKLGDFFAMVFITCHRPDCTITNNFTNINFTQYEALIKTNIFRGGLL